MMDQYLQRIIGDTVPQLEAGLVTLYEASNKELSFGEFACQSPEAEDVIRQYEAALHVNAARMIVPQSKEQDLPYVQDVVTQLPYVEGLVEQAKAEEGRSVGLVPENYTVVFPRNEGETQEHWCKRMDQLNQVFRERREAGTRHNGGLPITPKIPDKRVERQQPRLIRPSNPEGVIVYSTTDVEVPKQRVRAY